MHRFALRESINLYYELLWTETDAPTRLRLQRLLSEAEKKLGPDPGQRDWVERQMAIGEGLIDRQRMRAEVLHRAGLAGEEGARALLEAMVKTYRLQADYSDGVSIEPLRGARPTS